VRLVLSPIFFFRAPLAGMYGNGPLPAFPAAVDGNPISAFTGFPPCTLICYCVHFPLFPLPSPFLFLIILDPQFGLFLTLHHPPFSALPRFFLWYLHSFFSSRPFVGGLPLGCLRIYEGFSGSFVVLDADVFIVIPRCMWTSACFFCLSLTTCP